MKKNILIIGIISLLLFTGCGKKDNTSNKSNEVLKDGTVTLEDQKIDDLSFELFNIVKDNDTNTSTIYFVVTNNGKEAKYINNVYFTLYSGDQEKASLSKNLNANIEAGSSAEIRDSVDVSLTDVDKVTYSID